MLKISKYVREFHRVFGIAERMTPGMPDDAALRYHLKLIVEETIEIVRAALDASAGAHSILATYADKIVNLIERSPMKVDLPEIADGTIDLDWVSESLRRACGIDGEPLLEEVRRANMAKSRPCPDCDERTVTMRFTGPDATCAQCRGLGRVIVKREDGKVLKPEGWQPPDIHGALVAQGWGEEHLSPVERELAELKRAVRKLFANNGAEMTGSADVFEELKRRSL